MPRKKSLILTDAELRLMDVLWNRGPSTVGEVHHALPEEERITYSSVLTTLRILDQKGYLEHKQQGRAYLYRPLVERDDARRRSVKHLVGRLFDDSPGALVLNVLENADLSPEELRELRRLIDGSTHGSKR